jgi:predicted dinucleotide-binding enzyme
MKVGIIGTGAIGGTVARKLATAGHTLVVANADGPEATKAFGDAIGATAVEVPEAVRDVDVVIISIPTPAVAELPTNIFGGVPDDLVVVDTGNYYPGLRDAEIPELSAGTPESIWVSQQLGRPVIKAFNNVIAHSLVEYGRPQGDPARLAMAVSGDDAQAKQVVMSLVNDAGFDPVDAGTLAESWRHQPGTPAYCTDYGSSDMRRALAAADKNQAPARRDEALELLGRAGAAVTHADVITVNRSLNPID